LSVRLGVVARPAAAAFIVASACITPPPQPESKATPAVIIDVDVTLLPDDHGRFGGISSRMCPTGAWPRRIVPENRRALQYVVSVVDDKGVAIPVDDVGIKTKDLAGCLRLVVNAGEMADRMMDKDLALRAGDDVVITPDLWLFRPEPFNDVDALRVKLEASPFDALVPWDSAPENRAIVTPASFRLKSDAAFGDFEIEDLAVAGAHFRVARLDDGRAPPALSSWISEAARAVAAVNGTFPLKRLNILVLPTHVERPIVVGFFSRGGGPTALFFVGDGHDVIDDRDLEATGRWALVHELSHALMPPVAREDAWLNEGIATWYQDLLARRAGLIVDDAAYWAELVRGLKTGRERAREDGMNLQHAAARMHETGAYQHAYWGGVALVFLAEVEARKQGASIDDLVRALRATFPDDKQRAAHELLIAAPNGNARIAASELLKAWEKHRASPWPSDVDAALVQLGVEVDAAGRVTLNDDAPLASLRKSITISTAHSAQGLAPGSADPISSR
jgi:hypothetical protein